MQRRNSCEKKKAITQMGLITTARQRMGFVTTTDAGRSFSLRRAA